MRSKNRRKKMKEVGKKNLKFQCQVVTERQKLMADQIKIRRRQRKDALMSLTKEHIASTLNAAAALSHGQFPFPNLNTLLYNQLKTSAATGPLASMPVSQASALLNSPSSSDSSNYSPTMSLGFTPPPDILKPTPILPTPTSGAPTFCSNETTPITSAPISAILTPGAFPGAAPLSPNSTAMVFGPGMQLSPSFGGASPIGAPFPGLLANEALIQAILAQYKLINPLSTPENLKGEPVKEDAQDIDVCTV
ncbi:hypothetical protein WR25_17185 [Diploscapter pachys]|uniref:Uncharacterized protein n=1 Tax=Diploscapter pachys TaxID=2018661 RepID=A0A2A2L0S8_9BILA|nr:hypothetical protein WR25_17185 [Diploscapter pachys]